MSHRYRLFSVVLSVLLFSGSAHSQQPAAAANPPADLSEVQQKALKLLESLAGQMENLRSAENRARIGSNIAELLWSHDEKRARSLFAAAAEDVKAGLTNAEPDGPDRDDTIRVFSQLRGNIVTRIAKRDPELALEFLRSTRPPLEVKMPYDLRDVDGPLELQLAAQVVAKNPQGALELARKALDRGFSAEVVPALAEIFKKDKKAAQSFYAAIIDKLRSANLVEDSDALELALTVVRSFPPPAADEQAHRQLVGVLLRNALAAGCPSAGPESPVEYFCSQVGSIFPQIEKYYAARAEGLRRWAGDEQNAVDSGVLNLTEITESGSVDEILALLPMYPKMADQIYWAAMSKALASGGVTKARQIASDSPNPEQRAFMLRQLDSEQSWQDMPPEKLAEVQVMLASIPRIRERVQLLIGLASRFGKNNRKAAIGFLNQAAQILDSIKAGREQIAAQVQLAEMYCSLKDDRGFTIMESIIPKLNELVAAAAVLDRFDDDYLRDGEWSMSAKGAVGVLLTDLAQNAGYFAWSDFDRSVNLTSQFERPELRLMAQSKLAQAIMEGQGKTQPSLRRSFGFVR